MTAKIIPIIPALRRRGFHWVFEWDKATGFSCDRINYGPFNCSSSSWIIPGTIVEEEPEIEEEEEAV